MKLHSLLKNILLLSSAGFLFSCATGNQCPDKPSVGNLGSAINSTEDDYSPYFENGSRLYFTSTRETKESSGETIFHSTIRKNAFSAPAVTLEPPLNLFPQSGSASFYNDRTTGRREVYFAAANPGSARPNVDIYMTAFSGERWSQPALLDTNINSAGWDSQPAIASDGSFLVFSSDRKDGLGGADLYISFRDAEGRWSPAQNLGSPVNTPADERTPFIGPDKALFFASRGFYEGGGFEIVRANFVSAGKWAKPDLMPVPINSDADEISPFVKGDSLWLASNRSGGCGGYDLYAFRLCGPVAVRGRLSSPGFPVRLAGTVEVLNRTGENIARVPTDSEGNFELVLPGNHHYTLNYTSSCLRNVTLTQDISTPCSELNSVSMDVAMEVSKEYPIFSFENYDIPFFVTGYHMPNTTKNLDALRLLFSYNLLGANDSTKYIQFPSEEYDSFAEKVDLALEEATNFVLDKVQYLGTSCAIGSETIVISIDGFADPRDFTKKARYVGEEIADADYKMSVQRGAPMNNELLSQLRAYYTAKTLREKLRENPAYEKLKDRVRWNIAGRGIDDSAALPYERKRRVSLRVGIEQ